MGSRRISIIRVPLYFRTHIGSYTRKCRFFRSTSTLKTRDNFTPLAPLTINELQKAMKNLSLFPCSFFLMFFVTSIRYKIQK
jgi:hypothetical protein